MSTATLIVLTSQLYGTYDCHDAQAVVSKAFAVLERSSLRQPVLKDEYDNLCSFKYLVDKKPQLLFQAPAYPSYISQCGRPDDYNGLIFDAVIPTHAFANPVSYDYNRRCSAQSMQSSDYTEPAVSPAMSAFVYSLDGQDGLPNTPKAPCSGEVYNTFPVQQDGYDGIQFSERIGYSSFIS